MNDALAGPVYSLGQAKALVAAGDYDFDTGKSCFGALLLELDTMEAAIRFIEAAFELVAPADFCAWVEIRVHGIGGIYDEYAVRVPDEVAEGFGLRRRSWYLKFKQVSGPALFVLSLHPLHKDEHRRVGGPLRWT
jgi:hypothetical protein